MREMPDNKNIHPTAIIGDRVELGENVSVGPYSVIDGETHIGANSNIGSHCHIGLQTDLARNDSLLIGDSATIRSHSVFYSGSEFGVGLVTGHRVCVRENTVAGEGLQVGTASDIQGDCHIGNFVRLHSNVFVTKQATIGDFVWLFPYVVFTDDPYPPSGELYGVKVSDFAAIGAKSILLPGVEIGSDTLVGAGTVVTENVPDSSICIGNPGKIVGLTNKIKLHSSQLPAYPWRRHFHRGYPDEVVQAWRQEFPDG